MRYHEAQIAEVKAAEAALKAARNERQAVQLAEAQRDLESAVRQLFDCEDTYELLLSTVDILTRALQSQLRLCWPSTRAIIEAYPRLKAMIVDVDGSYLTDVQEQERRAGGEGAKAAPASAHRAPKRTRTARAIAAAPEEGGEGEKMLTTVQAKSSGSRSISRGREDGDWRCVCDAITLLQAACHVSLCRETAA